MFIVKLCILCVCVCVCVCVCWASLVAQLLKNPILWPPDMKNVLLEETLMLGKTEGSRIRGQQSMRCLDVITN